MSKIEVNAVEPQCGTTLTLGASGDTISIASGAKMSGVGTVSWDTTAKTASFTAASGEGYFVDTSSSAITATLPASPSAGDIVYIKDYDGSFGTNACTVARNSSNIRGATNDFNLDKNNSGAVFIYVDGTEGWQVFADGSDSDVQQSYISATGGTITTCGDYKIHTFTGPGTFTVNCIGCVGVNDVVDYVVVAGGGSGGGGDTAPIGSGGGGGAGGIRVSDGTASGCYSAGPAPLVGCVSALQVSAQGYPITVGGGGSVSGRTGCQTGVSGSNSIFSTITSTGGGGGGSSLSAAALNGGSGGGGGYPAGTGGTGNTPPVSPPQGTNGSGSAGGQPGGGGGGLNAGSPVGTTTGGAGGDGFANSITGSSVTRAGGGGGGISGPGACAPSFTSGPGGAGGGGNGQISICAGTSPNTGTANTGGGGGGGGDAGGNGGAGNGGSGIVIIRYKFQ